MPVFILLDLQLPVVSGFEVLEWVRARKKLKRLPITVFTGWDSPGDVTRAYKLGANSCVAKPLKFDEFNATVTNIAEFWLNWAKLPQVNADTFASPATRHVAQ